MTLLNPHPHLVIKLKSWLPNYAKIRRYLKEFGLTKSQIDDMIRYVKDYPNQTPIFYDDLD